jgi:hypothetical protein
MHSTHLKAPWSNNVERRNEIWWRGSDLIIIGYALVQTDL